MSNFANAHQESKNNMLNALSVRMKRHPDRSTYFWPSCIETCHNFASTRYDACTSPTCIIFLWLTLFWSYNDNFCLASYTQLGPWPYLSLSIRFTHGIRQKRHVLKSQQEITNSEFAPAGSSFSVKTPKLSANQSWMKQCIELTVAHEMQGFFCHEFSIGLYLYMYFASVDAKTIFQFEKDLKVGGSSSQFTEF